MLDLIRKWTPFILGNNLSGRKLLIQLNPLWLPVVYVGPFYFGVNLHINRFRQILHGAHDID